MTEPWVRTFFARLDRMDLDEILPAFADDACFRLAGGPSEVGRQSIRDALGRFFGALRGMRHEPRGCWCPHAGTALFEAEVHYTRADGRMVVVPAANILRFEGDKIVDYRVLADLSAVYL